MLAAPLTMRKLGLLVFGLLLAAVPARAENWPQWRGPRGNGTSNETNLPTRFGPRQNVLWRLPLPGPAGATPVVWEDRIFLTSVGADGVSLVLLCVSTDGKLLWQRTVSTGNRNVRRDEGNSASPSPVTDGQYVWATMGTGHMACFDFQGREIWRLDLNKEFGPIELQFGYTSTPVLYKDRLYVQLIHGEGNPQTQESRIIALDKRTGQPVWIHTRRSDARAECEHSYASPILYRDERREYLVAHGADYVTAHRLSDGQELWRCGSLNGTPRYNPTLRLVASPVAVPGLIVVPSAKNGPVLGLDPGGRGDITGTRYVRWRLSRNTPDVPSPVIHQGLVYLCRENGNLLCLDAETGQVLYQRRTHRQRHRASPVVADGKLYLTARDGVITVVALGREFKLLAQNRMEEDISSSPAISGGRIYLRTFKALYAIGSK